MDLGSFRKLAKIQLSKEALATNWYDTLFTIDNEGIITGGFFLIGVLTLNWNTSHGPRLSKLNSNQLGLPATSKS